MKDSRSRTGPRKDAQVPHYGTVIFDDNVDAEEPKVDTTQSLPVRSKRTERRTKKWAKKTLRASTAEPRRLLDLPYEILFPIICMLQPSDIITLLSVCKRIRRFILEQEKTISKYLIRLRYGCLAKCFRRPVLMKDVDPVFHRALRAYQHVRAPDTSVTCTCLTCVLRWNSLCIAVDFAYWQKSLDNAQPIAVIPRGRTPEWNQKLLDRNAKIVLHALHSDLFYTRVLEAHLASTMGSIRRHAQNKGNRRRRFRMTEDDVQRGTADFLEQSGPPTIDLPYHRDNYYMLEAFMPSRSWIAERNEWVYMPEAQHEKDLSIAVKWEAWKRQQAVAEKLGEEQMSNAERAGTVATFEGS